MKSWGRKSLKKFMGAGKVQKYEMVAFLPECLERQSFLRRLVVTYTSTRKLEKIKTFFKFQNLRISKIQKLRMKILNF